MRCDFTVVQITDDTVFIKDDNLGNMSVTNDAEAVCEWCHNSHPGKRLIYLDTLGDWDELVRDAGRFVRFARAEPPAPEQTS